MAAFMKRVFLLALAAGLLLAPLVARPEPPLTRLSVPPGTPPADVWLYLERTAGIYLTNGEPRGPVYHVTLYGDGTVVYVGEAGVRVKGERRAKVAVADLLRCVNAAAEQGFFDWEPNPRADHPLLQLGPEGQPVAFVAGVIDSPSVIIQIGIAGQPTWREPVPAPLWFGELARRVDGLADTARWVK